MRRTGPFDPPRSSGGVEVVEHPTTYLLVEVLAGRSSAARVERRARRPASNLLLGSWKRGAAAQK